MHLPFTPKLLAILVTTATALTLAGCDKADSSKTATQVAAKVNGTEISVHQINTILTRASGVTNENAPQARKEILDRLIDQELVVGQAMAKKLDRTPETLSAIEAARREVLSRAYLEQVSATAAKPSADEIKHYFDENPNLFSKRRIYNIQELSINKSSGSMDGLKEFASTGKSMEEIAIWLKAHNLQTKGGASTRPAEQIPLELLPKIATMKDGQTSIIDTPQVMVVLRLVSSQSAPVDESTAKPVIEQYLQTQRKNKAVADEMKRLKEGAKIEFVGDFAKPATAAAPAKETPVADNKAPPGNALEKGVAGLK
ncbi:EpsD family peptidyl-prolyl cis-trans isomerase [Dechloromonas sp. HYN0024]|uniref:EpsD family peptidyl-prolyl cis-trans isomerase n=1 Tax=Dechloromonas sp. HYN0024 TaxID=2231055 RepID=UPI000E451B78|nr:EpsD family peptidyl-prolyl cis-trans isomerase [Dechloromonas sp. HYN0024]AXS80102.1 peptidyl-prolyl cis-trans isomerase, EpsD family [Dechloromonas sp. HYN0024]